MVESYKPSEMMIVSAAKEINNNEIVFVGVGLPLISAILAKRTNAPQAILVTEHGLIDFSPSRFPVVSIVDPGLIPRSAMLGNMLECLGVILQGGHVDVGFLGAAQVDKYGNLNSTVIGDYKSPKVRLIGSGGANDIASSAKRVVIIMRQHSKQKLVDKIDYLTSPGFIDGRQARTRCGLKGGGPSAIITNLGVFRFNDEKEMYLESYYPGVTIDEILSNTGFSINTTGAREAAPPSNDQLKIIREMDPIGLYLK